MEYIFYGFLVFIILNGIFGKPNLGYAVVKSDPENGFEIRQTNNRMWLEITDRKKYSNYTYEKHFKPFLDKENK